MHACIPGTTQFHTHTCTNTRAHTHTHTRSNQSLLQCTQCSFDAHAWSYYAHTVYAHMHTHARTHAQFLCRHARNVAMIHPCLGHAHPHAHVLTHFFLNSSNATVACSLLHSLMRIKSFMYMWMYVLSEKIRIRICTWRLQTTCSIPICASERVFRLSFAFENKNIDVWCMQRYETEQEQAFDTGVSLCSMKFLIGSSPFVFP